MKHNENVATVGFKSQVDRMQDYLKAAGFEIPRTHLVEAAARFGGARDWRTLRAELESTTSSPKRAVPQLNGKSVRVYFDVMIRSNYGDGPQFCWVDINQAWVNRVYELRVLCEERKLTEIEDNFDVADWMDDGEFRINAEGITVTSSEFWYYGYPKHASYVCETLPLEIDYLMKQVVATEASELFHVGEPSSVDELMDKLGRDEDNPQFVSGDGHFVI